MTNPFSKPRTTGEWLRGSLCWTGSCLGAWWLGGTLLAKALARAENDWFCWLILGSAGLAHGLIWWRAVAGGRAIIRHDEQHKPFSMTRLAANLWLVVLTLFQVGCLVGPLILVVGAGADTPPVPNAPSGVPLGG